MHRTTACGRAPFERAAINLFFFQMSKRKHADIQKNSALQMQRKSIDYSPNILFSTIINAVYVPCETTTKRLQLVQIVRDFFIDLIRCNKDSNELTIVLLSSLQLLSVSNGRTRTRNLDTSKSSKSSKSTESNKTSKSDTTEFGIGNVILQCIIAEAAQISIETVKTKMKNLGDLATAAAQLIQLKPSVQSLTVRNICESFRELVMICGTNSVAKRKTIVLDLLNQCGTAKEIKFVIRLVQNNLRINLQESSVITALAHAFLMTSSPTSKFTSAQLKDSVDTLKSVYSQKPSFQVIVPLLVQHGWDKLSRECFVEVGTPIRPMLGKPLKSVQDMLKKLATNHRKWLKLSHRNSDNVSDNDEIESDDERHQKGHMCRFALEFKYDGKRAQIHCRRNQIDHVPEIKIFSRSLKLMNDEFPDVVELLQNTLDMSISQCIIDCEIICIDKSPSGNILSFQQLTNRSHKSTIKDLQDHESRIALCIFDVLYLKTTLSSDAAKCSLMADDYDKRILAIPKLFPKLNKTMQVNLAEHKGNCVRHAISQMFEYDINHSNKSRDSKQSKLKKSKLNESQDVETAKLTQDLENFLKFSLTSSCEGVMVKPLTLRYKPNDRSWYKLKKDYISGLADSLDLVPVGGYYGRGKRTGCYGSFLLACRNPTSGVLEPLCKTGTGFSEDVLKQLSESLIKISKKKCPFHASDSECDYDCSTETKNINSNPTFVCDDESLKKCDVLFEPTQVWEIICADLTLSEMYAAARGYKLHDPLATMSKQTNLKHPKLKQTDSKPTESKQTDSKQPLSNVDSKFTFSKGVSTRFPRFVKVRDDKSIDQATSSDQVALLYNQQFCKSNKSSQPIGGAELDDNDDDDEIDSDLNGSASD